MDLVTAVVNVKIACLNVNATITFAILAKTNSNFISIIFLGNNINYACHSIGAMQNGTGTLDDLDSADRISIDCFQVG